MSLTWLDSPVVALKPCCGAGITALSLLITPFLLQACRHILQDGSSADALSALPSVSLPVSQSPLPCIACCAVTHAQPPTAHRKRCICTASA